MSILEETKFIMKKYGIKAKKSLGQNFLVSEEVIEAITSASNITNEDLVIEIGPGLGTLTKYLLEKAGKVICVELDKKMTTILEEKFRLYDNIVILNEDILKVNLSEIIKKEKKKGNVNNVKVVANLPYYITTPIIMKLLEDKIDIESITVMIQKEVADRLVATPGEKNTGAITYTVYYYCESQKVVEVSSKSFIPEPDVESSVIKLKLRDKPVVDVKNEKIFFNVIKSAFMQRRKTLLNSLTNARAFESKEQGEKILQDLGINVNIRAEKLTINDFARISDKFQ